MKEENVLRCSRDVTDTSKRHCADAHIRIVGLRGTAEGSALKI